MRDAQPGGREPARPARPARPRRSREAAFPGAATRGALVALVLGLLLAVAAGCGGDDGPEAPANPATIRVDNQFGGPVLEVFLKQCGTPGWGEDRLGDNETIASGATRDFVVEAGCWDLAAEVLAQPPPTPDRRRVEDFDNNVQEGDVETVLLRGEPAPQ